MNIAIVDIIAFTVTGKFFCKNKDMNAIPGRTKFGVGIEAINNVLTSCVKFSIINAVINIYKP